MYNEVLLSAGHHSILNYSFAPEVVEPFDFLPPTSFFLPESVEPFDLLPPLLLLSDSFDSLLVSLFLTESFRTTTASEVY